MEVQSSPLASRDWGQRTPPPRVGKSAGSGDEQRSKAVLWCFQNLSATHIKLKCK